MKWKRKDLGRRVPIQAGKALDPGGRLGGFGCCTILAAGAIAVYSRTLSVPLILDDPLSIADNASIRRLWPIWPVLSPPDEAGVGGRPMLNLTYALNYAVGGASVSGYHVVNLLIHVLAGVTLFALVRHTLLRPVLAQRFGSSANALALAVSAIWAWHPLQTESVTYISQRAESLMGLFYLLTLYCFIRGAEADGTGSRRIWFSLSVLACAAGIGTKEVMVTAPLLVFLYDRTFISGSFSGAWRRNWPPYLALAATLLLLVHRVMGLQRPGTVFGVGFGGGVAWWDYGLTECRAIVKYLVLGFWPHPLVFDYGKCVPCRLSEVWPYALVLASLLGATAVALRRSPAAGFAASWFFLILAPTSSIVPLVGQSMAENRPYLSLAGLAALTVVGAFALVGRWSLAVFAAVAVCQGLGTVRRNQDYVSELAIWTDTVAKSPGNTRAHNNLGDVLLNLPGRLSDAVAQYQEALRLDPKNASAHNNLGSVLANLPGRLDDAIAQVEEALRLRPDSFEAHLNLGDAFANAPGRLTDAVAQYEEALRLDPDNARAHNNLGNAWRRIPGRLDDAIAQYEEALRLRPDFVEAHFNLAKALANLPGRLDDAIAQYEEALRLKPDHAEAHFSLAVALLRSNGRREEAKAQLEEGLRLHPNDGPARQILESIRTPNR